MVEERYGERRHKTTIRFRHATYAEVQKQAEYLNMSVAEYVNYILDTNTAEVQRKFVDAEKRKYEILMEDDTKVAIEALTKALEEASRQVRLSGTNLSALIRDIRLGILPVDLERYVLTPDGRQRKLKDLLCKTVDVLVASGMKISETCSALDEKVNEVPDMVQVKFGPYLEDYDDYLMGIEEGVDDACTLE